MRAGATRTVESHGLVSMPHETSKRPLSKRAPKRAMLINGIRRVIGDVQVLCQYDWYARYVVYVDTHVKRLQRKCNSNDASFSWLAI